MRRSPSTRYWIARLRPLARPIVWGPAIVLLLLSLFTWELFSRPEVMSYFSGGSTSAGNLSTEDQAIGADIDSLALLMNDIQATPKPEAVQTSILATPQTTKPTQAATNRLFAATASTPSLSQPVQADSNPQGVFAVFKNALSTQLAATSSGPAVDSATSPALPPNQLQAAILKLAATETPVMAQTAPPIEGTARLETSINAAPRSTTNSFSALVEGTQPIQPGVPPMAPLPIAPTPINAPVPAVTVPAIAPQQPAPQFGVVQPTPELNQQPFTTPRSIPGRVLGGGNINSFSNP